MNYRLQTEMLILTPLLLIKKFGFYFSINNYYFLILSFSLCPDKLFVTYLVVSFTNGFQAELQNPKLLEFRTCDFNYTDHNGSGNQLL